MLGYVKRNEVLDLLNREFRLNVKLMSINSKLATTADNDEDRARYWDLSEEYRIRRDEVMRLLGKLERNI